MEDGYQGQRGCGRRTAAGGAAGPGNVPCARRSAACRGRPGPDKSRVELQPRAPTFTSRTTTGWADDRGCGRTEEFTARRDLNPMMRRDRQWARTRMRPCASILEYAVSAGESIPSNGV